MDSIRTPAKNERFFWRPWQNDDDVTTTCADQGFASPPMKRTRVYYTDEQRQDMTRIHDPEVKSVIKEQLTRDFEAKKKRIREYLKECSRVRRLRNTRNSTRPVKRAIPATILISPPPSQPVVTVPTETSTTCMTSIIPTNRPSQPLEESLSLESVIMVPFLRMRKSAEADCVNDDDDNDDDYRYVSAAKFLGFYRIADERRD